jgi:hypothetical protein
VVAGQGLPRPSGRAVAGAGAKSSGLVGSPWRSKPKMGLNPSADGRFEAFGAPSWCPPELSLIGLQIQLMDHSQVPGGGANHGG